MKLVFDTSVWVEHLRRGVLESIIPRLRGHHWLWLDSVAIGELLAGCRTKRERGALGGLVAPFERAKRVAHPSWADFRRAGTTLSRLRERGVTLKRPGSALLDALTAAVCSRIGAVLVTLNVSDFAKLGSELPLGWEPFESFLATL